jgi:hypothetical protein
MSDKFLKEGDVIELKDGMDVYADIPEHFVYANHRGSFKLTHSDITLGGDFDYLCGKYIVTHTAFDGGGTGMGAHDVYPDGHHVFCVKADDDKVRVDFYQSGCFTAMIEDIKPVGKAILDWKIK